MSFTTIMLRITCLLLLASICKARDFNVINNLGYTIWVGIQGNSGQESLNGGGFQLDDGQTVTVVAPDGWGGRFWGRTNCNPDGNQCETGDCGNGVQCNGNGGRPPTTLAEITLNGANNQDFYDISLVNGFNLPLSIGPTDPANDGSYTCTTAQCTADVNGGCPSDLQLAGGGGVVGCQATCDLDTTNAQACCTGDFNSADTCTGGESGSYFEQQCPGAYSYAYDDATSTYTCSGNPNYNVRFGS